MTKEEGQSEVMCKKASTTIPGFEGGGRGHKPRNAGTSRSRKKQGIGFSSGASRKEYGPANTLIFSPVRPVSDF